MGGKQMYLSRIQHRLHNKMGKKKSASVGKPAEKKHTPMELERAKQQSEKKKRFAKIYREYSRRKYKKYRLQFPKLRESDIVDKIIKEWEAFSEDEKYQLQRQYTDIGGAQFMADGSKSKSSNSKSKSKSGSGSAANEAKGEAAQAEGSGEKAEEKPKKKKPSPKVRVFVEKATDRNRNFMDDSDFKKEQGEKQQGSDNESVEVVVSGLKTMSKTKSKPIKKEKIVQKQKEKKKQSEYLQFYKYYYSRLEAEHPRWSTSEITTIIKLLWKKRTTAPHKIKRTILNKSFKVVSGRVMYRREKEANGLSLEQIKLFWKLLPFESKKYWEKRGRGGDLKRLPAGSLRRLRKTMRSGSEETAAENENRLKWMNSPIKSR